MAAQPAMPERRATEAIPNNLPLQLTTFVGRGREKSEVGRLLAANRLVTLMGAGGAGKTRLALAVASDHVERFPDGVWLVELGQLVDPALVPRTAAAVLGVADQGEKALLPTLADALRHQRLLVILDNCEHLITAASQFAEALLRTCPEIRLLATSREALGVPGETAWRVPSLSLPDAVHAATVARLREYEAIQLFEARAKTSRPDFQLTPGNVETVAQICRRLDGIPLAIELAAARLTVLTPEQLAGKLDDRFRLLTGGSRSALPRQQTLRATMDWSYDLLSEPERSVLRRLSVFAGGCTLEAAEAVCSGDGIESPAVLDLLGHLVDKSLVLTEVQEHEARYRLLETVRQYARDRLVESGDAGEIRRRHRDWYLALVETASPPGADARTVQLELGWVNRLEREHDNLRAALEWSAGEADGAAAEIRLAAPLWRLWHIRGHYAEGRRWLEHALARSGDLPVHARLTAIFGASLLAWRQSDYARAKTLASALLDDRRAAGDDIGTADALMHLGLVALRGEDDFPTATSLFEQTLALATAAKDRWRTGMALAQLSAVARYQGLYDAAVTRADEARGIFDELDAPGQVLYAQRLRGHAMLARGDLDQAGQVYRECLVPFQRERLGLTWSAMECVEGLAAIARHRGQAERAARLFAAADNFRQTRGYPRRALDQRRSAEQIADARTALGDAVFESASAEGRRMTLEEAVDYALAAEPEKTADRGRPPKAADGDPLTAREREVAALVARGRTNREIATALVVSERTADAHVQNILNKLGFSSRAQIAAWAVERGLSTPATSDASPAEAPPRPSKARPGT